MRDRRALSVVGISGVLVGILALAQTQKPPASKDQNRGATSATQPLWNTPSIAPAARKTPSAPAARRNITGIWDAFQAGIGATGVKAVASFTPWGEQMASQYKPGDGPRRVPVGLVNDPLDSCDPAGFPRNLFFELRPFQVVQTPNSVLILYEFQRVWRTIWTDGRELPKDPEPRWYGYSVGRWEDDYTFVVQTIGLDERTWLDNAGNPHSADMRVEERYHRVDHDTMELTVKVDDPKAYTASWLGLDKLPLRLQPPSFDIREMICSPTEAEEYKKTIANPSSGIPDGK